MITREQAIDLILNIIPEDGLVIASNGKIGRELWELREKRGEPNDDFIMVGSMGCALSIAVGVAMNTKKKVYCLLGDGNFLMKMGTLATYRNLIPRNLMVYIINNGTHDSTGGQPTAFNAVRHILPWGAYLRVVDVGPGAREDLGRPKATPVEIRDKFMQKCQS